MIIFEPFPSLRMKKWVLRDVGVRQVCANVCGGGGSRTEKERKKDRQIGKKERKKNEREKSK